MTERPQRQYLDDVPPELQDLLYAGQKIEAIKLAREKMGCGLKDAKEKVDAVHARLHEQFPEAMPAQKRAGCGSAVLLFAVLVLASSLLIIRFL